MNKILIALVALCIALSTSAFADNDSGYAVYNSDGYHAHSTVRRHHTSSKASSGDDVLGFQFGPSISSGNNSVTKGDVPDTDTRTRPAFGFVYEHRFMPVLSFRSELNYVQRGLSTNVGQGQNAATVDEAANYLELPLMAKAQYQIDEFTPYFVTGPFIGLLTGSGQTVTQNGKTVDVGAANAPQINTFDFGWNFGVGSTYAITKTFRADVAFRYSMGLTNVESNTATNSGDSTKLNAVQIIAGVGMSI